MSLVSAVEEAFRKSPKPTQMTPVEMVQFFERKADGLIKVLDHMQWVMQTVHQAHHQDQPGTWLSCPKSICESTGRLLIEVLK